MPSARHQRRIVVAVDESEASERALQWVLDNLYRDGDEIHFVRVVPRQQQAESFGAPPVDFLPQQDPVSYHQLVRQAEAFVQERLMPKLAGMQPAPVVHIVKAETDTDSVGNVLCKKVEQLEALALVLSAHSKSKLQTFFLGSVTSYAAHHCTAAPVLIVH